MILFFMQPFARLLLFRGFYSLFCEIETTPFASQPHPARCALRSPFARPLLFRGFYSFGIPCYNGKYLQARFLRVWQRHSCNPCYNGKYLQGKAYCCKEGGVVILVIMESTYRKVILFILKKPVVILVIMESTYRFNLFTIFIFCVVILVIMESTYRF